MRLISFLILLSIFSSGICSAAHACAAFPVKKTETGMSEDCMAQMAGKDGPKKKLAREFMDFCNMSSCCHMWIGGNDILISAPVLYPVREVKPEGLYRALPPELQFRPPRAAV